MLKQVVTLITVAWLALVVYGVKDSKADCPGESVTQALTRIEATLSGLQTDIGKIDAKVDSLETKVDSLDTKFGELDHKVNDLTVTSDVLQQHFYPHIEDVSKAVVNVNPGMSDQYGCRLTVIELIESASSTSLPTPSPQSQSKYFMLTGSHCYTREDIGHGLVLVDVFADTIPDFIFTYLARRNGNLYANFKSDAMLFELVGFGNAREVTSGQLKPIKIDTTSSNFKDCDPTQVSNLVCCCARDCSVKISTEINHFDGNFVRGNKYFTHGESGCICKDSRVKQLGNEGTPYGSCLFVNSHRSNSFSMPNNDFMQKMKLCQDYQQFVDAGQVNCNEYTLERYNAQVQQSVFDWISKLGFVDIKNFQSTYHHYTARSFNNNPAQGDRFVSWNVDSERGEIVNSGWVLNSPTGSLEPARKKN